MTITVLMTVYNGGQYLKSSIEHVLKQTFKDFELLIVDDCSTDDSLKIARSFNDDRVVVIENTENIGQTKSLNKGLNHARGKYVARMDADDLAFPRWLERQLAFIQRHPEYSVVSARAAVMDSRNRVVRILKTPLTPDNIILRCLTASPINHVGSLMHTQIILSVGGYDERFTVPADYDLWSRLIRAGHTLASTGDVLVAIRFHEHSVSVKERGEKDIAEMSEIMFENIRHLTAYPVAPEDMKLYWRLNYHVEGLDEHQFHKAAGILKGIYAQIKPELGIRRAAIDARSKEQIAVTYMKKIFFYIHARNVLGVRHLSKHYLNNQGWSVTFALVWMASFFGIMVLRVFPHFYERGLRMGTKFTLRKDVQPEMIF